jgi:hypothetical protein
MCCASGASHCVMQGEVLPGAWQTCVAILAVRSLHVVMSSMHQVGTRPHNAKHWEGGAVRAQGMTAVFSAGWACASPLGSLLLSCSSLPV